MGGETRVFPAGPSSSCLAPTTVVKVLHMSEPRDHGPSEKEKTKEKTSVNETGGILVSIGLGSSPQDESIWDIGAVGSRVYHSKSYKHRNKGKCRK